MPRSRTPLKGEPNFTKMSEEKLRQYQDCIQDMIFAYKSAEDKESVRVLEMCFKDISNELTEAIYRGTSKSVKKEESKKESQGIISGSLKSRFKKSRFKKSGLKLNN